MPLDVGSPGPAPEPAATTKILRRIDDRRAEIQLKDGRVLVLYWTTRPKEVFTTPPTDKQWQDYAEAWAEKIPANHAELLEAELQLQRVKLAIADFPSTRDEKLADWLARREASLGG